MLVISAIMEDGDTVKHHMIYCVEEGHGRCCILFQRVVWSFAKLIRGSGNRNALLLFLD